MADASETSAPKTRVIITTLGRTSVHTETDAECVGVFGPGKTSGLLAYLSTLPNRRASRDHLIGFLWADKDLKAARHALRQTIWYIKQKLGDEVIFADNGNVALADFVECDRDRFLTAVTDGHHELAAELYHGDFLGDSAAPGGAEFEQWAYGEKERLQRAFFLSAETLISLWLDSARARDGVQIARRVRDYAPWREQGWKQLIEALLAANDQVGAALEADALRRSFETDARELSPAILETLKKVDQKTTPGESSTKAIVADLVGRETEFSAILESWRATQTGKNQILTITAPAGLGKTRLIADVVRRIRSEGARVVTISGRRGEQSIPYSLAAELSIALTELPGAAAVSPSSASSLVAIAPSLGQRYNAKPDRSTGSDALRARTFAIAELIREVAIEQPIAVFIDDLHWSDKASRQTLESAIEKTGNARVLMVAATRPSGRRELHIKANQTLELKPLTTENISTLLAGLGELPDAEWAEQLPGRIRSATTGSPLLVLESLQLLGEKTLLTIVSDVWTTEDPIGLLESLAAGEALRSRIDALKSSQRRVILTLAIAGAPVDEDLLAKATGQGQKNLSDDLNYLQQTGFVVQSGEACDLTHDEIADGILGAADGNAKLEAHLVLGRCFADLGNGDPSAILKAGHHLASAEAIDELSTLFSVWLAYSRKIGDRRAIRELAKVLCGGVGDESLEIRVTRGAPLFRRFNPIPVYAATLTVLVFATIKWVTSNNPGFSADAELLLWPLSAESSAGPWSFVFRLGQQPPGERLSFRNAIEKDGLPPAQTHSQPSDDGLAWTWHAPSGDEGGNDIFAWVGDSLVRHTESRFDDVEPSISPDHRFVVFQTGRWRSQPGYDLAIGELITGNIRPFIVDSTDKIYPTWSHDGSRIAFWRQEFTGVRTQLCVALFDGEFDHCYDSGPTISRVTWTRDDPAGIIGYGRDGIILLDLDTGVWSPVPSPLGVHWGGTDKGGDWFWGLNEIGKIVVWRRGTTHLTPIDDLPGPANSFAVAFNSTGNQGPVVAIAVGAPTTPLPLNTPMLLTAQAFDQDGSQLPLFGARWAISDPTVASITSAGVIIGESPGTTYVSVSNGGWHTDSVKVVVERTTYEPLVFETWDSIVGWELFGDPMPMLLQNSVDGSTRFWNRGDDSWDSGAYWKTPASGHEGLGIEVEASIPLSGGAYQSVGLAIDGTIDPDSLELWDHVSQSLPKIPGANQVCAMFYPGTPGRPNAASSLYFSKSYYQQTVPIGAGDGSTLTIRVQLFPDGTCGIALNGVPLLRTTTPVELSRDFFFVIGGRSKGTTALIGQTDLWKGVKPGVPWEEVEGW